MADALTFATPDAYAKRYGEPADGARVAVLLEDASALMLSAYEGFWGEPYTEGTHPAFDRSAEAVACLIAKRVMSAPASMMGATQYSSTAGSYNASVTFGSGLGEMYLGKSDLKRLGLEGQALRSLRPLERGEVDA